MTTLTTETINSWADNPNGPVALHLKQKLVPVEGESGVIFPPTYADIGYNIDELSDGTKVATIDSVGSQANRMEPIFKQEPYSALVPQIEIELHKKEDDGETYVEKRSLLDLAHRSADAVVHSSPTLAPDVAKAFHALKQRGDAGPLCRLAPTSLLFGVWDSRGASGQKRPRLVRSIIRAWDVQPLYAAAQFNSIWKALNPEQQAELKNEAKAQKTKLSEKGFHDTPGDLRSRGASRRGEGRPAPGCDRLRRRQTPCAVPYRATPAQTRPGYLSLPASGQRGDHGRRQLYELVGWRRVMTDTPQVLLAHHLKTLKLPTFLREYDKLARQCATEGADHVRYLVRLTELELIDRERRMVERRIRQARFPAVKSLDSFDFKAIASLNKMLVLELARCEYVERRENIIALGNSGTGKTHIALGLGLAACQKGLSVGFLTAAALVHELMEARDEKRLLRLQKQLAKYHLLIIDELGFVPLSKTGAELLFEVFSQRYERGSILVTSNLPFDEWTEIFGSERLTGALLDRLTHHVHILEMNGESYRLNQSQKRRKSPKIPA